MLVGRAGCLRVLCVRMPAVGSYAVSLRHSHMPAPGSCHFSLPPAFLGDELSPEVSIGEQLGTGSCLCCPVLGLDLVNDVVKENLLKGPKQPSCEKWENE